MNLRSRFMLAAALTPGFLAPHTRAQEMAGNRSAARAGTQFAPPAADERPDLPRELKMESAVYLQRRLGQWTEAHARTILGEPRHRRDAYEQGVVSGEILAFRDPTRRYREFELEFDRQTSTLRAVFIYPWKMTWQECRALWGDEVNTTPLTGGNLFRSYRFRRLDVLVDKDGQVINLGLY